ncbi:MAG: hypothetical protein ACYC1C_00005, partial [Chloroflexota bacterium]
VHAWLDLAQPKMVVGLPALARLHVERKDHREGSEATASLFVEGRGGIVSSRATSASVAREAIFEIEAIAKRLPDPTAPAGAEAPSLRVHLALEGRALVMGAPVEVKPCLEAFAEPAQVSVVPDRPGSLWLCIRSNLPTATRARLQITGCEDIKVAAHGTPEFMLAPGGVASVSAEVQAPAGRHTVRVMPLLVGENGEQTTLCKEGLAEVPIVAGGPSDAFAYRTETGAVLENAHLRATVTAKGGTVRIQTKNPASDLVEQRAAIGPPYSPTEFAHRVFEVAVDVREGVASVHLAAESAVYPGLLFRRTVTMTASPRLETEFGFVNSSDKACSIGVRVEHMMRLHSSLVAVPLPEGLLVDSAEAADWEGGDCGPDRYAETWASLEREDMTVGFLWPEGSTAQFSRRFGPFFGLPEVVAQPCCTVVAGRIVLYAGTGGWHTVRDQWRRLFSPTAPEQPPKPVRAARVDTRPGVVAWYGRTVSVDLAVQHLRGRALNGKASLVLPDGWQATQTEWPFAGLRRGQTGAFRTEVEPSHREQGREFPRADEATLSLDANLALAKQPLALLALGHPSEQVNISEASTAGLRTVRVDNGWAAFTVAPEFAAAVVAYEHGGQNHLYSTFPEPGELMWQRPFFGGIGPAVAPRGTHFHPIHSGHLHEEKFDVVLPATRTYLGAEWKGVRLASDLRRPAGLHLEIDYLTLGGSNLLLVVTRMENRTGAPSALQSFVGCYLQVGGQRKPSILRYVAEGEHNTRLAEFDVWLAPSADWAAVENEETGLTAALISGTPWAYVEAYDLGLEGAHLFNAGETLLPPGETDEYLTLFVLSDRVEKARRYRALGWSGEIGPAPEH